MNIAFIGAGNVGAPLAARLAEAGHQVTLAETKEGSASVARALERSAKLRALPIADALDDAEVVFLATPFPVNESLLPPLAEALRGKVLVDCTNPVGPGLSHGLAS
ncbi:MAG: NAD(P)-binding domain-containing protein, partial [Myxococcales bacterium]|nr:NAD(P)-binding domain-containing protein [Myxococcales bacterium]